MCQAFMQSRCFWFHPTSSNFPACITSWRFGFQLPTQLHFLSRWHSQKLCLKVDRAGRANDAQLAHAAVGLRNAESLSILFYNFCLLKSLRTKFGSVWAHIKHTSSYCKCWQGFTQLHVHHFFTLACLPLCNTEQMNAQLHNTNTMDFSRLILIVLGMSTGKGAFF